MKFYKLLIISLFFIFGNSFTINLEEKQIRSQVLQHPVDEILYTTKLYLNGNNDYVDAVFDLNASTSWIINNECSNCQENNISTKNASNQTFKKNGNGGEMFYVFAGQILFLRQQNGLSYDIGTLNTGFQAIGGKQIFDNITFWTPYQIASPQKQKDIEEEVCNQCSKVELLKYAQAGIGMGPLLDNYSPFMKNINKKIKLQQEKFSFYYNENVMQIIFGEPQQYFKTGDWNVMKNARSVYHDQYSIQTSYSMKCIQINIDNDLFVKLDAVDPNTRKKDLQLGVFTSTSKYIYFGKIHIVKKIVDQINTVTNAQCTQSYPHNIFVCENRSVPISKFPVLVWTFEDNEGKRVQMKLNPEYYVEIINYSGVNKVILLLRPGKFELQQSSIYNLANPDIWLGYPFFKQYYMSFDYKRDEISFAERYQIQNESKLIENHFRQAALIISGLILLGVLFALLTILQGFPQGKWVDFQKDLDQSQMEKSQSLAKIKKRIFIPKPIKSNAQKIFYNFFPSQTYYILQQPYNQLLNQQQLPTYLVNYTDEQSPRQTNITQQYQSRILNNHNNSIVSYRGQNQFSNNLFTSNYGNQQQFMSPKIQFDDLTQGYQQQLSQQKDNRGIMVSSHKK